MNVGSAGFYVSGLGVLIILVFVFLVAFTTFNFAYILLFFLGVALTIYGLAFGTVGTVASDPEVTKALGSLLI